MGFHVRSTNKLLRMMTSENLRSTDNVPSVKKQITIYIRFHYLTPSLIIYVNLYRFNTAVINVYICDQYFPRYRTMDGLNKINRLHLLDS